MNMERQPLSEYDRALLGAIMAADAAWREVVDAWSVSPDGLNAPIEARAARHPATGYTPGVIFPVGEGEGDLQTITLSPTAARELADRLAQQVGGLGAEEQRPWQWWLPDLWRWDESFSLTAEQVGEVIEVLREAADYVDYGPENWPFDRALLKTAAALEPPIINITPDLDYDQGIGWEAQVRLAGGLGHVVLRYSPIDEGWSIYGAAAHEVLDAETWARLEPILDEAVEAASPHLESYWR
jgi:hypothetical protein